MTLAMTIAPPPDDAGPLGSRRRLRLVPPWRPQTRADCASVPRPCPYVGCRYNNFLNVTRRGHIWRTWRDLEPHQVAPEESCALDLIDDRGGIQQLELAEMLRLTDDAINLIQRTALATLKLKHGIDLKKLLALMSESASEATSDWSDPEVEAERGEELEEPARELDVDLWGDLVAALMRGGIRVGMAWAIANHLLEDTMNDKKGSKRSKKKASKGTSAAIVADIVENGATRPEMLLGKSFTARHPVTIDQSRRDKVSEELVAVLGQIDDVNEEKSNANGGFNTRLKELREKQHELAEAHRTSKEKQDVRCQQYLTPQNEVIVRRLDTSEIVERRAPTAQELEELQVPMFAGEKAPAAEPA